MIKSKYTSGDLVPYLESLTVSQGRLSGQRFKALPWQVRFVCGVFHEGVQSAALSVARGNGKTSLLSAIACAYLGGPLAVQRGEVVIVASSFLQARLSFEHVLAFLGDKLNDRVVYPFEMPGRTFVMPTHDLPQRAAFTCSLAAGLKPIAR